MIKITSQEKHDASKKLYRDAMYIHLLRAGFSVDEAELILSRQS